MKENMVRMSFDIPIEEHIMLKTECAQMRVHIKDFLHEVMLNGLQALKKKSFQEKLKESIQQSKEGKTKHIDVSRFSKYADE